VYQSRVQDVEELLDIWHGLQQSAIDSAIDGEHILAPAYGPKEDILSSGNMLIAWAVIETMKQCFYLVEFRPINSSQSYPKSLALLCHHELVEQLQHFQTFMFHVAVQQGL